MILPQQQAIRDVLDTGAVCIVCREFELSETLRSLTRKPRMVVTDSQAFAVVSRETPEETAIELSGILGAKDREFVIVIYGKGASEDARKAFRNEMKERFPRTELCEIDGGQDVYEFILIFQ